VFREKGDTIERSRLDSTCGTPVSVEIITDRGTFDYNF
jgi:hypothetical protein